MLPLGAVAGVHGGPAGVAPEAGAGGVFPGFPAVGTLPEFPVVGDDPGFGCAGSEPGFDCAGFVDPAVVGPELDEAALVVAGFVIGGLAAVCTGVQGAPLGVRPVAWLGVAVDGCVLPGLAAEFGLCGFCPGTGVAVLGDGVAVAAGGAAVAGEVWLALLEPAGVALPAGLACASTQLAQRRITVSGITFLKDIECLRPNKLRVPSRSLFYVVGSSTESERAP